MKKHTSALHKKSQYDCISLGHAQAMARLSAVLNTCTTGPRISDLFRENPVEIVDPSEDEFLLKRFYAKEARDVLNGMVGEWNQMVVNAPGQSEPEKASKQAEAQGAECAKFREIVEAMEKELGESARVPLTAAEKLRAIQLIAGGEGAKESKFICMNDNPFRAMSPHFSMEEYIEKIKNACEELKEEYPFMPAEDFDIVIEEPAENPQTVVTVVIGGPVKKHVHHVREALQRMVTENGNTVAEGDLKGVEVLRLMGPKKECFPSLLFIGTGFDEKAVREKVDETMKHIAHGKATSIEYVQIEAATFTFSCMSPLATVLVLDRARNWSERHGPAIFWKGEQVDPCTQFSSAIHWEGLPVANWLRPVSPLDLLTSPEQPLLHQFRKEQADRRRSEKRKKK